MSNLAINFVRCAVVYALIGMGLGIFMAASGDHGQAPTHAHINLVGWASMGLFGLVYRAWPSLAEGLWPKLHFWSWNLGVVLMIIGLFGLFAGSPQLEPFAVAGSLLVILGMLIFATRVFSKKAA
jgi:hypothetical protein